jgi:hypothetical protein
VNAEPYKEALEVRLDGARIHVEVCRDFGVTAALKQKIGDLSVPQAETDGVLFFHSASPR